MNAPLCSTDRTTTLDQLERESFDIAIVGGGITGAGIAREAALRGQRVALFESHDFASGTSSRSSKLIHGGLRYLAMGDVALVRSTALERKVIFRLAPHLAEPLWLVVPARSRAGMLKLRAGITAYEKLGAVEEGDLHQNWGAEELAENEPALDRSIFKFACVYREYLTDDARLVLANLRSAATAGAVALNYAPVTEILQEDGHAVGVTAQCRETGRSIRVRARCVINAAGPWVELVRELEDARSKPLLHLSKGVHIVLHAERLPVRNMTLLQTRDKRSIFVIPRGRAVYVGTTDTTYEHGHDVWPRITDEDVNYLLEPIGRCFTGNPITPGDVAAAWAGLRPLIAEPGKQPHEISRRDEVLIGPANVVTIAGGKLTGYRPMAVETLTKAAEVCGLSLGPEPDLDTAPRLPGGDFDEPLTRLSERVAREFEMARDCADRLTRLYGTEAPGVANRGAAPLVSGSRVIEGEIDWAIEMEGARRLEDAFYRRTRAALYNVDSRNALVEPMAQRMGTRLGWSEAKCAEEVAHTRELLAADLNFRQSRKAS